MNPNTWLKLLLVPNSMISVNCQSLTKIISHSLYIQRKLLPNKNQFHHYMLIAVAEDLFFVYVFFAENTRAKSDAFAATNSLPKFDYVLHPRTTGFTFIVEKLRKGRVWATSSVFWKHEVSTLISWTHEHHHHDEHILSADHRKMTCYHDDCG